MDRDKRFLMTFVASLAAILFFMGATLSGYVIYSFTMYCEHGICKTFCYFDEDCSRGEVCCTKLDFGVCVPKDKCEHPYELEPFVYDTNKLPDIERPAPVSENNLLLYTILLLLIVGIGAVYYSKRREQTK
ncbi:hypothetical protein DRJ48_00855 [Candidatus Woesearchaeota archaeon]|nr:hypothetical protein [Candidatus Woesearchaeota archaeon]RLE43489.1 MAG: hypothetical protein DRJ48_00855 [Candidatus Woesearchaeota archaeon]